MQQVFEFVAPEDRPTSVCFRPPSTVPASSATAVHHALKSAIVGATTGQDSNSDGSGRPNNATAGDDDADDEVAEAAVAEYHVVIGYESGCIRVFHVPTAQMVEEYR